MTLAEFEEICKKALDDWMDNPPPGVEPSIPLLNAKVEQVMADNFPS